MNVLVFFSCLWTALVLSKPNTNSTLAPPDARKCLDSSECLDLDLRSCDCGPEMVCIIKERTCEVCPTLDCVREPEHVDGNNVPIIAISVVGGVILLLGFVISFLYFRNREEVTARGGVVAYIKYRAQRDSILQLEFTDDQVLLSKSSTSISENDKRSSVASMFLTAKSSNISKRIQPKVMVLESDAASIATMDNESGILPELLPYEGPLVDRSTTSALHRDSFGLSSFGITSKTLKPPVALSRESKIYATAESQFRPMSTDSFATQILSNPFVSAGLTPRAPSISNAFFTAQGAAHNISLSPPPPSADPRNSQVLPSEDSIILHYK